MPSVRRCAITHASAPLTPFTIERRALRDDDVAHAIKYCGVCHTDIHLARGAHVRGYAESIVVKEGYVLPIPDGLPLDATAPLLCAGVTMHSPLRRWKTGTGPREVDRAFVRVLAGDVRGRFVIDVASSSARL